MNRQEGAIRTALIPWKTHQYFPCAISVLLFVSLLHGGQNAAQVVEKNPGSVSELFAKFDRKNKGVVDRRDVAETLREVFTLSLKEDQLDRLLHEFDPDDSGDIEYKEFIGAIEAYSFRSMVERKKKSTSGDAIRALQSATHHSSRDLDNFSDVSDRVLPALLYERDEILRRSWCNWCTMFLLCLLRIYFLHVFVCKAHF